MKKVKYGALFLALVGVGFASCEKEVNANVELVQLNDPQEVVVENRVILGGGCHGKFKDENCEQDKVCCSAVVVVSGAMSPIIHNTSGDLSASSSFFSTYGELFTGALSSSEIAELANGNVGIEFQTTTSEVDYFAIRDYASSTDLKVIPIEYE